MIDIKTATVIRRAWIESCRYYYGGIFVDADALRQHLQRENIGYYKLREYLQYYLPGEYNKRIDHDLRVIYFPQEAKFTNDNYIQINILDMNENVPSLAVIKVINKSDNPLPEYKTEGASGMDICAFVTTEEGGEEREFNLMPFERRLVHTGLYVQLPHGTELQIRSRSGIANDNGVIVLNAPGTVDEDYRGEIMVNLINLSQNVFTVKTGERIAQGVLASYIRGKWKEVEILDPTKRADGGHGHTGK